MKHLTTDTYDGKRWHAECYRDYEKEMAAHADSRPVYAERYWYGRKRGRCARCGVSTARLPRG